MTSSAPIATIVMAQLFGTSLWFSANSAADDLTRAWNLAPGDLGWLTNAVQLGFIVGTLVFALSGLADRYAASRIFAVCATAGALSNAAFAWWARDLASGLPWRFMVGLAMAGVYPLGMKLVVSWSPHRVGAALAQLVGMLTLGIALPHGVHWLGSGGWSWQMTMSTASALALLSAAAILWLGDGPHLPRRTHDLRAAWRQWGGVLQVFRLPAFRASALGYFGHQWELYALWTLTPALIALAGLAAPGTAAASGWAFAVIGVGALSCWMGGWWSQRAGSARVAATALLLSALCCAVFPLTGDWPVGMRVAVLLLWGAAAVMDSPHFSAMSARACPPDQVGSALALQNSIGFAITMVSIQASTVQVPDSGMYIAWLLLPGPLLGLWGLWPLVRAPVPKA